MNRCPNDVVILAPEKFYPSQRAMDQLRRISGDQRIEKPVLALIDIHDKDSNDFPTGIVAASREYIFPQLLVSGPNCGMRMLTTPLSLDSVKERNIEVLYSDIFNSIHTGSFFGDTLSKNDILGIMKEGAGWIERKYSLPDELKNIELNGDAFSDNEIDLDRILEAVPQGIIELSKHRMGILGKGNHFLEMQVVDEIFDERAAASFSIKKGMICFLMHSGSGGLGAVVSDFYSPRTMRSKSLKMQAFITIEWIRSIFNGKRRKYLMEMYDYAPDQDRTLFGLKENTPAADLYLTAIRAASNFAYANRTYLSMHVKKSIARRLKIKETDVRTLYDLSHMSIKRESHNGKSFWIHRTGSVSALPSELLLAYSPFKDTGTPIFLPGSMGDSTYICISSFANNRSYYSASHGAGRLSKEKVSSASASRDELVKRLKDISITLYNGHSKNIIKQDPSYFKDISVGVRYLEEQKFVKKVARLRPVAVLKD